MPSKNLAGAGAHVHNRHRWDAMETDSIVRRRLSHFKWMVPLVRVLQIACRLERLLYSSCIV